MGAAAVAVEVLRGGRVDCVHYGKAVVVAADGHIIQSWGDIDTPFFPHSAFKPIQALPLISTGAADAFTLSPQELTLACSSHLGDPVHVDLIESWLSRLGLNEAQLLCGRTPPFSPAAVDELRRLGRPYSQLHNNNSGKHAAFLTTALHMNEPLTDYIAPRHSVQHRVRTTMSDLMSISLPETPDGIERCGAPAYAVRPFNLALAMARIALIVKTDPQNAASRLLRAVCENPRLLVGRGRWSTRILEITGGNVIVKGGADGVYAACIPSRALGLAVKIEDGSQLAADTALLSILAQLGAFDDCAFDTLPSLLRRPVFSFGGEKIGETRCLFRCSENSRVEAICAAN